MKAFNVKGQRQRINVAAALILGADFLVMLAALMLVLPPQSYDLSVLAPHVASAVLMTAFGPYLFVASGNALLTMLLMVVHLVLLWALVNRVRFFDGVGHWSRRVRLFTFTAGALLSVLSVWCEIPVTERYEIASDKIGGESVRLTVISDLHSCAYGGGQMALYREVAATEPDAVLFAGDIFDDRLPDDNAQVFIAKIVKNCPCFYVSGNHEYWSERVDGMKKWLRDAGVTVLEGECRTLTVKGTTIDICGVDDPTYMADEQWLRQLRRADEQSDPAHIRILLTHRPERAEVYGKFAFDLVLAGHAHGGQWLIPFVGRGSYSPDQHFFPKYVDGSYKLANGREMLVSRGLARESTPLPRLFNPPEILSVVLSQR